MEKKDKNAFTIRIPPKLDNKLTEHVAKRGMTKTAFICNLVYEALEGKKDTKQTSGTLTNE